MSYVVNDTTHVDQGLIQECERITNLGDAGISGDTTLLRTFISRLNQAKDRFFAVAFKYDTLWNFDDSTRTDLPVATTNIVSTQRDYLFDRELLMVTQAFAKDSAGVFHELSPQDDRNSPKVYDLTSSSSGVPTTYELVGNSILLDPAPNYASSGGLKVVFKRNGLHFTTSSGAVPIGIPDSFFGFLARHASYPYLIETAQKHAPLIRKEIGSTERGDPYYGGDELAIANFIANRSKPRRAGLRVMVKSNK